MNGAAAAAHGAQISSLDCAAFRLTPDLRFVFPQATHEAAFITVLEGLRNGAGLLTVTGEAGIGKSTLLRRLERDLQADGALVIYIPYPEFSFTSLLTRYCVEFGLPAPQDESELDIPQTAAALLRPSPALRRVVLLDDADRCSTKLLADLLALLSTLSNEAQALQIVMAGTSLLSSRLQHDFAHVRARSATHVVLSPLDRHDIGAYIRHRLRIQNEVEDQFSTEAVDAIARYSHGIPRLVNQACGRALLLARLNQTDTISQAIILEAIDDCPATALTERAAPPDAAAATITPTQADTSGLAPQRTSTGIPAREPTVPAPTLNQPHPTPSDIAAAIEAKESSLEESPDSIPTFASLVSSQAAPQGEAESAPPVIEAERKPDLPPLPARVRTKPTMRRPKPGYFQISKPIRRSGAERPPATEPVPQFAGFTERRKSRSSPVVKGTDTTVTAEVKTTGASSTRTVPMRRSHSPMRYAVLTGVAMTGILAVGIALDDPRAWLAALAARDTIKVTIDRAALTIRETLASWR